MTRFTRRPTVRNGRHFLETVVSTVSCSVLQAEKAPEHCRESQQEIGSAKQGAGNKKVSRLDSSVITKISSNLSTGFDRCWLRCYM